jgi:glutamyl/glutaminyl-tRNA synthetase
MEEEEVERKILLEEVRLREADELRKMELNTLNLKNFVVQFQDPVLLASDKLNNNNSNAPQMEAREKTFITEIDDDIIENDTSYMDIQSNPEGTKKKKKHTKERSRSVDSADDFLVDEEGYPLSVSRQGFAHEQQERKLDEQSRAESKMKFINALLRKGVQVSANVIQVYTSISTI